MGQDGFKIVQDVFWKRLKKLTSFLLILECFWGPSWDAFLVKNILFGRFFGYTSWSSILYRFWEQLLIVFSLFFGCFLGVSFTCVAFRVNFANVRFTQVKRRFVGSCDVTKYISLVIFRLVFACLFLHAFSNGFGDDFGKDFG